MEWLQSFETDQLQFGFMGLVVLLVALVWFVSNRHLADDSVKLLNILDWFELRGLGTIFHLLVMLGALGMAWIGWRLPAELEQLSLNQGVVQEAFPITTTTISRLAQVVGALGFALIALRSMRFVVPVMAILIAFVIAYLSYNYITFQSI